jgi:hypothetical protein
MTNDQSGKNASVSVVTQQQGDSERMPYHQPSLVYYGKLAELVQINPAAGSDGGTADCQHI